MRNFYNHEVGSSPRQPRSEWRSRELLVLLLGAVVGGCGGGGDSSSSPPAGSGPPSAPAPSPAPAPTPAPPATTPTLPPLSSTVIDLDDNHAVGVDHWAEGDTAVGAQGETVGGLDCVASMSENYHVHTHVSIFLDGEALAVPASIGIVRQASGSNCFYTLHTHDKSGKIHVEAPAPGTFTLGQLFAIWGQPLEGSNFAGITGKAVVVYVTDAGVVTLAQGDWHDIELLTHREVTVQIGTPIDEIPNFTWSAN